MGARRRGGRGARVSGVEGFGACEIWGFFRKGLAVVEDRAAPCVRGRAACWEGGGEKEEDGPHGAGAELGCCVGGGEEEGGGGGGAGDGAGREEERWVGGGEESRGVRDGGGKKTRDAKIFTATVLCAGG